MLNHIIIIGLSLLSCLTISYLIYVKIIAPLANITRYLSQARFEHNIISKLEDATHTQGLSDHYNLMLDNNLSESSYFDKLKQSLQKSTKEQSNNQNGRPCSAILNQAKLLQQKKKQIKYH